MTGQLTVDPPIDRWGWPTATADRTLLRLTVQYDPATGVLTIDTAPAGGERLGRITAIVVTGLDPDLPRRILQDGEPVHYHCPFHLSGPRWHRSGPDTVRVFTPVGEHCLSVR